MMYGHFDLRELVCPEYYTKFGEDSIRYVDERNIAIANFLRERFGKAVTINNWHTKGQYHESGVRIWNTTTGGETSQHKFGRANDYKIAGMLPAEIRADIEKNWTLWRSAGLTCIEDTLFTPSWLHGDCRNTGSTQLLIVKP